MTTEQAIEILKCFKNNEIQRDKLEIDKRCGGWKIGRIYKSLELNTAIEKVMSMLEEKDKIIDLMAEMLVKVPNNSDSPQTATIIAMMNRDLELRKIKLKQYFENKVKEVQ